MILYFTIVIDLGCHEFHPCNNAKLIDKCFIYFHCFTYWLFPHLYLPLLGLPIPWDNHVETRPVHSIMVAKCSGGRRNHTSLTLKKLEMIKLSEEGMLKAKKGHKLGPWPQMFNRVVNRKQKFLREIKHDHRTDKKAKWSYCWYGEI